MGTLTFLDTGTRVVVPDDADAEREAVVDHPELREAIAGSRTRRIAGQTSAIPLEEVEARYGQMPGERAKRPTGRRASGNSGNVRVRMPRRLHRELAEQAAREGVSLNTLIVTYLAHEAGVRSVAVESA
jgi:hypothetical protein